MDHSVMFARALGLVFTIFGLGALLNKDHIKKALDLLVKNDALQLVATIVPLIVGSFLVVNHNIWDEDWQVLVTIACWFFLVVGSLRALFPSMWIQKVTKKKGDTNFLTILFTVLTALGVGLIYFGFMQN